MANPDGQLSYGVTFPKLAAESLMVVRKSLQVGTLDAALTLDPSWPTFVKLDPGGAHRNITLDAEADTNEGMWRVIVNAADAAENLVVKDAAANTIGTVNQNEAGIFYCQGSAGWTLVAIITIALS